MQGAPSYPGALYRSCGGPLAAGESTLFGGPEEELPTRVFEGSEEVDTTKKEAGLWD